MVKKINVPKLKNQNGAQIQDVRQKLFIVKNLQIKYFLLIFNLIHHICPSF
jgi:hypothetical protein